MPLLPRTLLPFLASLCALLLHTAAAKDPSGPVKKKGIGLSEKHGFGADHINSLNVGWFYNWSPASKLSTPAQFVPMIFSLKTLDANIRADYVLGFNEPDHEKQSNIPVKDALARWPAIKSKGKQIGSPAMAGNPVTGDWLPAFMRNKHQTDFICVHWYKGADTRKFINDMEQIHQKYDKPIWITEFAPQTDESTQQNPAKFSQQQVEEFIKETTRWMESTNYIHRYAWHHPRGGVTGTSSLFDKSGALTATGKAYAEAGR